MSKSIPLSKKHGANPTMLICFWCGKEKGIALMGKLKGDAPAPPGVICDYDPCPECEAIFNQGIQVIGVTTEPIMKDMPPISHKDDGTPLYPDTTYFVAREEYANQLYPDNPEAVESVLRTRRLLMPSEMVRKVIESNSEEDSEDESNESGVSEADT